ncbi:MAG: NAD(P)/FAD-dependent oxidoreductase [Pseudomonadota bacterium]
MTVKQMSSDSGNQPHQTEDFDVIIIGAGISGIAAAYELSHQCPEKNFAVLEGMENFGGTWRWHIYPGVRSDSDLFTFGFRFKPWLGDPIASGADILNYLGEAIEENDLAQYIRYDHRVVAAAWDSAASKWTLDVQNAGEWRRYTCNFLWMCQGYYRHAEGYTPNWDGMDDFKGRIIHPQLWPEDLDYKDKKVVVIGSGATAATLVPAMAGDCAHITMLQRSPTYFSPGLNENKFANTLREIDIDPQTIHEILRKKLPFDQYKFLQRTLNDPERAKADLRKDLLEYLSPEEIDEHFTPSYRPWQQRIAVVPNGDLFVAMKEGAASVVTDHIDRFTQTGLQLRSGKHLDADIIVTATGFVMNVMGDVEFSVDDQPIDFSQTVHYRGMMFTGVPNMLWIAGYSRAASWTLKVDLVGDFCCRLLNHMEQKAVRKVEVALRPEDADMELQPWADKDVFNPGYLQRALAILPKGGDKEEWIQSQDYWREKDVLPSVDLDDPIFVYDRRD